MAGARHAQRQLEITRGARRAETKALAERSAELERCAAAITAGVHGGRRVDRSWQRVPGVRAEVQHGVERNTGWAVRLPRDDAIAAGAWHGTLAARAPARLGAGRERDLCRVHAALGRSAGRVHRRGRPLRHGRSRGSELGARRLLRGPQLALHLCIAGPADLAPEKAHCGIALDAAFAHEAGPRNT